MSSKLLVQFLLPHVHFLMIIHDLVFFFKSTASVFLRLQHLFLQPALNFFFVRTPLQSAQATHTPLGM